ncbi:hypothetical protein KAR91_19575 [Candidatus Pacearchaeota archaeon]|nr:hypothetical protein [Candidatus Pacearchaeota archaeon]
MAVTTRRVAFKTGDFAALPIGLVAQAILDGEPTDLELASRALDDISFVMDGDASWVSRMARLKFLKSTHFAASIASLIRITVQAHSTQAGTLLGVSVGDMNIIADNDFIDDPVLFTFAGTREVVLGIGASQASDIIAFPFNLTDDVLAFSFGVSTSSATDGIARSTVPLADFQVDSFLTSTAWWNDKISPGGAVSNVFVYAISRIELFDYYTTSPSTVGVWEACQLGAVLKPITARLAVFKDGILQALTSTDVQIQYAVNGGALSGWMSLSAFRTESDIIVTNTAQAIKFVVRYISDGSYKTSSRATIELEVDFLVADPPAQGKVQQGVVYDNGDKTGTRVDAPVDDVTVGTSFGEDGTELDGTYKETTEAEVVAGVQYGANGIEFTGIFSPVQVQYRFPLQITNLTTSGKGFELLYYTTNDTVTLQYQARDFLGAPLDITGLIIRFASRINANDPTYKIAPVTADHDDDANGIFSFEIPLPADGYTGVYEVEMEGPAGNKITITPGGGQFIEVSDEIII